MHDSTCTGQDRVRTRIDRVISEGRDHWHAIIEASKHRMRTIASIAAAASHALIPIARDVFESRWHTSSLPRNRCRGARADPLAGTSHGVVSNQSS
jgi:hypothetical protein